MNNFKTLEHQKEPIPFIRNLYEDKSEGELQKIEDNFREYIWIVEQIAQNLAIETIRPM